MKSYVCVLSTNNYLEGVLILKKNLEQVKSKYNLLCLVNEDITEKTKKTLEEFEVSYKEVKSIPYIDYEENDWRSYWKYGFDKINVFNLTEYEKVVYLDLDLLILKNLDHLFDFPSNSMPLNLPYNNHEHNTCVMVVEPRNDIYERLKNKASESRTLNRMITIHNLIDETLDTFNNLSEDYNVARYINKYERYNIYDSATHSIKNKYDVKILMPTKESSKIIHYSGNVKPFMINELFEDEFAYLYLHYLNMVRIEKRDRERNKKLVSIIVPVYNKEKYLAKCLNSIINQTYKNLEIILINDASKDKSLEICKLYQKYDSRIVIIDKKKNEGVSAARNSGLDIARGDYIGFVDADDFIKGNMYEIMVKYIDTYNVDFVQCGAVIDGKNFWYTDNDVTLFNNNDEIISHFISDYTVSSEVWNKLYKKEFIGNRRFDLKYSKNEDLLFVFDTVKEANKMLLTNRLLYYYEYGKDNSLTKDFSFKKDEGLFLYIDRLIEYIDKYYPKYNKKLKNKLAAHYVYILRELLNSRSFKKEIKTIKEFVTKTKKFVKENSDDIEEYNITMINESLRKFEIKIKYYDK